MPSIFKRQWFLISLVLVFTLGFCFPHWFESFAHARTLRNWMVASVLFVMSLPLDTKSVGQSIRHPWPAVVGSLVNMALLPLIAWMLSRALVGDMRTGLLVAAAVPCTLASAAVWTRKADGDDTVAILVTAITNATCFLTTPFLLFLMTGNELSADLQAQLARMPIRLAVLVVLPMAFAQLLRQYRPIGTWASAQKSALSSLAQVGILSMVLAGSTFSRMELSDTSWGHLFDLPLMFLLAIVLHLTVLYLGFQLARALGFHWTQQVAVGISGSQKTLMVGLDIAISYFGGLAILPMVTYHFVQLVVDTVVADRLRSRHS